MITREQYMMGRDVKYPLTPDCEKNWPILLGYVNELEDELQMLFEVDSGYRPKEINDKCKNAAPNSWHIYCAAIDIKDPRQYLGRLLYANKGLLEKYNLYMEHPKATPTWVHLQIYAPKSGNRIFVP